MTLTRDWRRWAAAVTACLLLGLAGCGPRMYPVRGTVTLEDGTPVARGLVIFERVEGGPPLTARGDIQPDGRYELSTETPGDGVPAGRYRVSINPLDTSDVPDEQKTLPFDVRYLNQKTSGLEFEVKSGPNEFPIRLAPPAPKGKGRS
jgi:hypothetical protein